MSFKSTGGRPRLHQTKEEAKRANHAKRQGQRQRQQQRQQGPADFIFYEPSRPFDVPADTQPELSLRAQTTGRTAAPPRNGSADPQVAERVRQIEAEEQEGEIERAEYEAEIEAQLRAMAVADAHATAAAAVTAPPAAAIQSEQAGLQHSSSQYPSPQNVGQSISPLESKQASLSKSSPRYPEQSISPLDGNRHASGSLSQQARSLSVQVQPQTPVDSRGALPSRSRGSDKRRGVPVPPQRNSLLSWLRPDAGTSLTSLTTPPLPSSSPSDGTSTSSPCPPNPGQCVVLAPASQAASEPSAIRPPPSPSLPASGDNTPAGSAGPSSSPSLQGQTARKLARQLWRFQGCTHEQHRQADREHRAHHQQSNVRPECSSFAEVTALLGRRLPDVLSSPRLMKATDLQGVDCRAAFEGSDASRTSSESVAQREHLPLNLCLSSRHTASERNRQPNVTFDIDSVCCFPTSLAVSQHGINWYARSHPILNIAADIHLGLKVHGYTSNGKPSQRYTPLHKIPHTCFGSLVGMEELLMFIFFPALHETSSYEHTSYLSDEDEQLWLDAVVLPALRQVVGSSNIFQHYPASARVAKLDSTAVSAESLARKESARAQLLKHAIQPQYLDALWTLILETVSQDPGLDRFQGATLFMHAKNTKLQSMATGVGLTEMFDEWRQRWSTVADPQFYNQDRMYVDLAKQTTSEDSALPYDQIPSDREAEVFLWRKCCLDTYATSRMGKNADGSRARSSPKHTTYPWAMLRDSASQTLFAAPQGQETEDGLIYTQFYMLVKTPFDSTKIYIFDNDSLENLALDPGYIRALQQAGGGVTFSKGVCQFAYLHSKQRAHANLTDNQWRSYGVREEHRISLRMMEQIYQQWRQWDIYDADDKSSEPSPLPYFIVPTAELFGFLSAQINKYCLVFEHVLAHTARSYSLPETVMMVTALRALRFCYGSSLLARESLLYKDRWEQAQGQKKVIVKEGLGMQETIKRCGLGWFLPKINWETWRFRLPHGENILVGNMLMHEEYKRRWRAVKDLRDVYVRFSQAEAWYDRYAVQGSPALLGKWLEYLHALNMEQFDADVWKAMLKAHKRSPELTSSALERGEGFQFCQRQMKRTFLVGGVASTPHFVTGNKMRFEAVAPLLDFLFLWEDGEKRPGWGSKPYRAILQKSFDLIERRLGYERASGWLDEYFHLIRLTHWILPYPSDSGLIASTKTSRNRGLTGRMMWFSAVLADPALVELPLQAHPTTLHGVLWRARRQARGDGRHQGAEDAWDTAELIAACRTQGLRVFGQEETSEFWVAGKRSVGLKGFVPLWERAQPPRLKMSGAIRGKSLDELEELMLSLSREHSGPGTPPAEPVDAAGGAGCDGPAAASVAGTRDARRGQDGAASQSGRVGGRSIMAQFGRRAEADTGSGLAPNAARKASGGDDEFVPSSSGGEGSVESGL